MHYRNGIPAHEGDHVITKDYAGKIVTGRIFNLREQETCNCDVTVLTYGAVTYLTCQNVGTMYLASDAYHAIDELMTKGPPWSNIAQGGSFSLNLPPLDK